MRHQRAYIVVADVVHDPQTNRTYRPGDRMAVMDAQRLGLPIVDVRYEEPSFRSGGVVPAGGYVVGEQGVTIRNADDIAELAEKYGGGSGGEQGFGVCGG